MGLRGTKADEARLEGGPPGPRPTPRSACSSTEWKAVFWAGLLAGLAFLTRTTGYAVIGAGLVALLAQRRWKHAALFGAIAVPFVAGWVLWQHAHAAAATGNPIDDYYTAQNYTDWNLLRGTVFSGTVGASIAGINVLLILTFPARGLLCVPFNLDAPFAIQLIVSVPVWILVVRGILAIGRRSLPWVLYAGASIGIMSIWAWPPERFLLPLSPLLVGLAFVGVPRRVPLRALPVALASPLFKVVLACSATLGAGVPAFAVSPWGAQPKLPAAADWNNVVAVCDWIKRNAPPEAVVMANYDPLLYLYTGHGAVRPLPVEPGYLFYGLDYSAADSVPGVLNQIARFHPRYLVETGREESEESSYRNIVEGLMKRGILEVSAEIAPGYRIYRMKRH